MHGIKRITRHEGPHEAGIGITRITFRYSDGRVVNFVPDASRETFSEDDILELQKVIGRASSVAEWSEVTARSNV